ncbi:MAG: hypothetical protein ACRDHK_00410 [Actinomycetota bacterium]
MVKRYLMILAILALVTSLSGIAQANHPDAGYHPEVDGSEGDDILFQPGQHGSNIGHLPATQQNVNLVGKLELTDIEGAIADVGYFKGFAYLNAWAPNCPNGGGVHVVDVRDPSNPVKVGFLPANVNEFPGEGVHIMEVNTEFFQGDILLHNNEACTGAPTTLGMAIWDVTDPLNPVKIGQFGDPDPPPFLFSTGLYHSIHNVQGWTQGDRAFAVMVDNEEAFGPPFKDVDIVDLTDPFNPVMASESGLEDWPDAQAPLANGDSINFHDMQFKRIRGNDFLAVSYWDAGQVLLNVNDPYDPVFLGDSDYLSPDPVSGFEISEGNSHESYWSSNNKYLLSSDEDFAPFRTVFELTDGPNAGVYGAGEFGWTPLIADQPDEEINGPTVFGGRGCFAAGPNAGPDALGDPMPPPASAIAANPGEEKTVVFSRGGCFFSTKVAAGQDLGYDAVIIGQSHGGTRGGILVDGFTCGGQGHNYDEQIPAICTGHRAMHLMFNDPPGYSGPEGADIPLGTLGARYHATGEFDGWGYVNLHDATDPNLPIIGTYTVPEAQNEAFASGFGDLTVHEVKTDPRPGINLAYFSYYAAGFRVAEFGANGIREVGRFIDEGGNNFWGVFPIGNETCGHGYPGCHPGIGQGRRPLVLASDRDFGLYIFDYTGKKPKKD